MCFCVDGEVVLEPRSPSQGVGPAVPVDRDHRRTPPRKKIVVKTPASPSSVGGAGARRKSAKEEREEKQRAKVIRTVISAVWAALRR